MSSELICPSCRKPLPPDVPLGLCPECLLKSGLGTGTEPGADSTLDFEPPPIEELAALFPQFEVIRFVGRGGMGAVYQARQPALDRFVALKILSPAAARDPGFSERFSREARALARLNHPNIVAIHDFGTAGPLPYLAMEYVDGMNLRVVQCGGRLAPREALQIIPQICDALQFAHTEGIVHRDIKPENILLDKKGRVKITDFGIAKMLGVAPESVGLTGARDIVGTPPYMAPEQMEHPQAVDHRADIFSLGVVFYELLTGELPLGKFAPPSQKAQVDARLDDVVLRTLEKEPEHRYQQASQVKEAVTTITSGPPSAAAPTSQPAPKAKGSSRVTAKGLAGAAAFVLVMALIRIFILYPAKKESRGLSHPTAPPSNPASTLSSSPQGEPTPAPATESTEPSPVAPPPPSPAQLAGLRYQWKPGETCVYQVKVEATGEDDIETVTGTVTYNVRAVNGGVATLSYRSYISQPQRRAKPGRSLPPSFPRGIGHFWSDSPFARFDREIRVDATGRILEQTGNRTALPQALGDLEQLVFETVPTGNKATWQSSSDCTISLTTFVPISPMSRFGRNQETILPARETVSYKAGPAAAGMISISKHYELKTSEKTDGEPRLRLTGDGTITFDTRLGRPRSMEFKGQLVETTGNTTVRTPLTLTCSLLEGEEKERVLRPPPPVQVQPQTLAAAEMRDVLIDLRSADTSRRHSAAGRLAFVQPAGPRSEVAAALAAMLSDRDQFMRQSAARALGVWGTPETLPALIKVLDDPEFSVRWAAIEALGKLKAPSAAGPLARHMGVQSDCMQISQALIAFGPAAEDTVIGLLRDKSQDTRREACSILKEIGTAKSVSALTAAAANDPNSLVVMFAKEALRAIDARQSPAKR